MTRVVVVDSGDEVGVSRFVVDGMWGVGIGMAGVEDEIRFTNLRSNSS